MGFRDELKQEFVTGNIVTQDRMYELIDSIPEKFSSRVDFPATGDPDKLYIALDEYKIYYWNGTAYIILGTEIVQVTGQSEEDVMSQKATTNMIINPNLTATKPRVRINSDNVTYVGSNNFGTVLIDAKPSSTGIEAKIGDGSVVIGGKLGTVAKDMATIVGVDATAGVGSVAIGGGGTNASGESSIAIRGATVSAQNSIAMGLDSTIDTGANYSVALGSNSYITGMCSQSIGTLSKALCNFAAALGYAAQLSSDSAYSVVLGSYSKATVPSVVSVGDGTSNADYGTRRIVNVKDPTGNQDAATKAYVDVSINNAIGAVLGGSY